MITLDSPHIANHEPFTCECGTIFYRRPRRLTACPKCLQVVVDVGQGDNVQTIRVFHDKEK